MSALTRAETEYTQWRGDGTIAGISAVLSDGVGREVGFWDGPKSWGHQGTRVQVYGRGRNNQTNFSVELYPADVRRLAASLLAMADAIEARNE